jgi:hypothetical protein
MGDKSIELHLAETGWLPVWRPVTDMEGTDPEGYAHLLITQQIEELFKRGQLVESWHLVYERAYRSLRELASTVFRHEAPVVDLGFSSPVTSAVFRTALLKSFADQGLVPEEMRTLEMVQGRIQGSRIGSSVDLGELDADILWLEQQGRVLTGPLLPAADLEGETLLRLHPHTQWVWDRYTDKRLAEAAWTSLAFFQS